MTDLQPILEIGGTHVTAALIDTKDWSIHNEHRIPVDSAGSKDAILASFYQAARTLPRSRETRWGIAIPGPFDYVQGIGTFQGVGKYGSLNEVNLNTELRQRLGELATAFMFVNDAEAFALGEWISRGRTASRAIYLTLGSGIGSAFLDGGRPVKTAPGIPPNGEVHLLEWNSRPIEDTVSRRALMRAYRAATDRDLDVKEIADAARAGEQEAIGVIGLAFFALGACLAPAVKAFGADAVIAGGSISRSWDLVSGPLLAGIAEREPSLAGTTVLASRSPHDAPLVGAGYAAQQLEPTCLSPEPTAGYT